MRLSSGGSGEGGREGRVPSPPGSKFFQFHAVFGKIWQNRILAPPGELAPPPRENPGSAFYLSSLLYVKYDWKVFTEKKRARKKLKVMKIKKRDSRQIW